MFFRANSRTDGRTDGHTKGGVKWLPMSGMLSGYDA